MTCRLAAGGPAMTRSVEHIGEIERVVGGAVSTRDPAVVQSWRRCIDQLRRELPVSERRICRVLGQHRSTQRKVPCGAGDEQTLTEDIIELARQYGRYGYRRVTALLHAAGWSVNHKRVERIWRREGLKVPQKQPKRGRLWLNDGSCVRLRPGVSGISCVGGHNGKEGAPICPDAKSLRYRTSFWTSCWLAVMPAPPWRREGCWMR